VKLDVKDLKVKVNQIQEDKSKATLLLDILAFLDDSQGLKTGVLVKAIHAVSKAVLHIIKRGDFESENVKYKTWLEGVYDECWQRLLAFVPKSEDKRLCELALTTLMHFLKARSARRENKGPWSGEDNKRFKSLLAKLTFGGKVECRVAIERFREYLEYTDCKAATIRHLAKIVHSVKVEENKEELNKRNTPVFRRNVMRILELLNFPQADENVSLLGSADESDVPAAAAIDLEEVRKNFSSLWLDFFWLISKDVELYKRVLVMLHDRVMPHMNRPILLTDFLMESYDVGGSISLLALSGVFHLIQKHNLEYPDFYKKLYALFTPEVLHVKYRARFFHLADLFLKSPLLPEYLVAAFVKRLARLALTAPACTLVMVMQFIGNLMIRHPGLHKMASCQNAEDPYLMEEADPAKCKANESNLWEVLALQSHALPQVAQAAKFINKPAHPTMEWAVNTQLENTFEDMFETETKKKVFVNVPLTFERPNKFQFVENDLMSKLFQ